MTGLQKLLESLVYQSNGCDNNTRSSERYILSGIISYVKELIDVDEVNLELLMQERERKRSISFLMWKSEKGYYAQGATKRSDSNSKIWIRQENQVCFSTPISSNDLYDLFIKSNQ